MLHSNTPHKYNFPYRYLNGKIKIKKLLINDEILFEIDSEFYRKKNLMCEIDQWMHYFLTDWEYGEFISHNYFDPKKWREWITLLR